MPATKRQPVKPEESPEAQKLSTNIETPSLEDQHLRMSYRIARGEQGVLSFEPYKSAILPLWRFKTVAIARSSSAALFERFEAYGKAGDFVGMDMSRKFIQMGMTRAKRYANHKGGRKYAKLADGSRGEQLPKSEGHQGMEEKLEASNVFREVWEKCRAHDGYQLLKEDFLREQKAWDKDHPKGEVSRLTGQVEKPVKIESTEVKIKNEP